MIEAIQFASFSEFLDMGGYGFAVWSVYAIFAVFIAVNLIAPIQKRKKIVKDLKRRAVLNENSNGAGPVENNLGENL